LVAVAGPAAASVVPAAVPLRASVAVTVAVVAVTLVAVAVAVSVLPRIAAVLASVLPARAARSFALPLAVKSALPLAVESATVLARLLALMGFALLLFARMVAGALAFVFALAVARVPAAAPGVARVLSSPPFFVAAQVARVRPL